MHLETMYKCITTTSTRIQQQHACLIVCLYIHPTLSKQEGHELLCLQTNCVIMRNKVTPVLAAPSIITQVHALASPDGMLPVLKSLVVPTKFYSTLLGLQEWIMMKKSFKMKIMKWNHKIKNIMMKMKMKNIIEENELAEKMGEPHWHNVPN